jgi:ABC-type multidrug transport system fused ATPase/permease subunit
VGGVALLATESIKLTLLMLSVVPLVAVAAVILVHSKICKSVQDKVAESQVIVEETMQELVLRHSPMNGTEIARYDGK